MRRFIIRTLFIFMVLSLFFAVSQPVSANSGPTFWEGYPSYEVLAVDENCPIEVESEKLFFDLGGNTSNSHTIGGRITAAYEMVNPTSNTLSVQMAFPFVCSLNDFSAKDISITEDGAALPYNLFIGDVVKTDRYPQQERKESFDFADIVNMITDMPYKAENFSENEKGKLYTLAVKPTTEERINLAVDFEFDRDKTRVLSDGFNRYEKNGQKVRIAAWCYEPEILEIFVLGDDIDFNISAFADGELKENTNLYECQTSVKEADLKTYIMDYIKEYEKKAKGQQGVSVFQGFDFPERQLYNIYAAALDKLFTGGEGYGMCLDLMEQNHFERILTLVYTVDFPANSKRSVSVGYKATGTMDKTKTAKPIYSFGYILNPAKTWSSFKNLNIEIITPKEAPYIINSNIELKEESNGHYTASLGSLPDNDFTFSVYSNKNIKFSDRANRFFQRKIIYFILVLIVVILIIAGAIISAVLLRYRGNI